MRYLVNSIPSIQKTIITNKDFDSVFMLLECQLPIIGMSVTNRHLSRLVWIFGLDHIEGIRPDIEG